MRRRRPRHPSKGCGSGCARVGRAIPLGLVVDRRFLSIPWVRLEPFPVAGPTRAVPWSSDVALRKGQDPLGWRRGTQAMTAPRLLVVSRSLPAKGEPPPFSAPRWQLGKARGKARGMGTVPGIWARTASKSADCARKGPGACSGAECVGCLSTARRRKAGCEREGLSGPARPGRASRRRQPGPRCRRRSSRGSGRRHRSSAWRPLRTSGRRRARCTSST